MPNRHIFNVPLAPVAGSRFQPTGFPDLGTGTFEKPTPEGWVTAILVESEQSMANHLEASAWDKGASSPVAAFASLPYVRVIDASGEFLTSSRTEAHRLSSAFIREGKMADGADTVDYLKKVFNLRDDKPMSARAIASAVLALDPACLVHGVFFADPKLPGQPKITRALTSFIEAVDVRTGVRRWTFHPTRSSRRHSDSFSIPAQAFPPIGHYNETQVPTVPRRLPFCCALPRRSHCCFHRLWPHPV